MEKLVAGPIGFGLVILAWMVLWHFLLRGVTAQHANSPAMQGLSTLT
jgi:hypothetical protein